jgi:hypothetical protein
MTIRIGDVVPEFIAHSAQGKTELHDGIVSRPKSVTPVSQPK